MPVIGLGAAMVTVWTPYPVPPAARAGSPGGDDIGGVLTAPAEDAMRGRLTDEMLARALTDDALASRLTDEVLARVSAASHGQPGSTGHTWRLSSRPATGRRP